jgi:hypothetical protein
MEPLAAPSHANPHGQEETPADRHAHRRARVAAAEGEKEGGKNDKQPRAQAAEHGQSMSQERTDKFNAAD